MPNVKVVNMAGKEVGEITLSDVIFGAEVNEAVLHAAVRAFLMNQRQGTQSTLTRSEVSGGGKKPWRQKGTGLQWVVLTQESNQGLLHCRQSLYQLRYQGSPKSQTPTIIL